MESNNFDKTEPSTNPSEPPESAEELVSSSRNVFWNRETKLALGALGVVYGDIGTSPLYTIKECFTLPHGVEPLIQNVLGILSLIFWSLIMVVVVKYLTFVMRADNRGEGGIMALLTLLLTDSEWLIKNRFILLMFGLFGSSLLWADGMITPSITVLSAIEGLEVATPLLRPFVVPITSVILIVLFMVQKRGTSGIGSIFGPAMLVWFICIGCLGLPWIIKQPAVLQAMNPYYGAMFFVEHKLHGFLLLGSVVLCVTGSEALYADMGHFGRFPIRLAWYSVVFPGLLLNYFGQGAAILTNGTEATCNPFYFLSTGWFLYPMVLIATMASIIASQALITGAFSLTQQAMQLGYSPRWTVIHTSEDIHGQIYIPEINIILMFACVGLVLTFQKSSALAAAYGLAVSCTMAITSFMLFYLIVEKWKWKKWHAAVLCSIFLFVDLSFVFANGYKIVSGGWFPLVVGIAIYLVMTTWKLGQSIVAQHIRSASMPLDLFMEDVERSKPVRVRGTAIFMTSNPDITPFVLLHHYKHNKVLHDKVILLSIITEGIPKVTLKEKLTIKEIGNGFYLVVAACGYMQVPNVPHILHLCEAEGLKGATKDASYYLGRVTVLNTGKSSMRKWRESLFVFLYRNARPATAFFRIPPNRVIELGIQIKL